MIDRTTKEWWTGEIRQIPEDVPSFEEAFARRILAGLTNYARTARPGAFAMDVQYLAAALEAWDALDDDPRKS